MDRKMLPTLTFVVAVAVGLAAVPTVPVRSPDLGISRGQWVTIDPNGLESSCSQRVTIDPDGRI